MKFLTSDHVELDYTDEGQGQPVLLLNGIGSYKEIWLPVKRFLLDDGYRVINLDARNQGASQRTSKGERMTRHAIDVYELLTELRVDDVIGIGNSMGASTLFAYVSLFGEHHFKCLVDIDQSPKMITDDSWSFGFESLTWKNFPEFLKFPFGPANATPVETETRNLIFQARKQHPYDADSNYCFLVDHAFQDWRDVIRDLRVPLLIVVGKKSPYFDPKFAEETVKLSKICQSVAINNAGHILMAEQPAFFEFALSDFLNSVC